MGLRALDVERLAKVPGMHFDGEGLYLRVTSPRARSWLLRYMLGGRAREMGLGSYPEVTLAEARRRAADARRLRADGIDPISHRENLRRAERGEATTFKQAARQYIEAHSVGWKNAKHRAQWSSTLATYAEPVIGALPVQVIDTAHVLKVLEPIWETKPETASRVRGRIEAILAWAKVKDLRQGENPARWRGHLDHLLPSPSAFRHVQHHAAMPYSDLPAFMARLRQREGLAARALEFAILTAARTGEVIGALYEEIDTNATIWTIPADRMKGRREHRVPLPARCLEIIAGLGEPAPGAYLFPGTRFGKPLSNMALLAVLRRMKRGELTTHGFRSTFRDWVAEQTDYPGELAEAALAHITGDKVELAYRRGDLLERRRQLMHAWAEFCAGTDTAQAADGG